MKLDKIKNLDVERVGELSDSIQAGISKESLPFVFDIISRQLYSNPIGSIIREITSNCFDSHKEANVDDPVIIRKVFEQEENQWYIEFQDFGVGLSPERIESVYMNYFSSTKRDNNEQIGGFGLGSKTPLAYSDLFYILTRFEGIEYSYVFHKGEDKPTLDMLHEIETTERNGTCIRVPIKNDEKHHTGNECYLFESQLKEQLLYFESVYFEKWSVRNNYKIYEGKYFKFRSDIDQSKELHICMGKVTYPINFNIIKVPSENYRYLPIAVKFDIGELPVTPSREELRYNDETKKLILDRILKAVEEIVSINDAQNPEIQTIEEYNRLKNSIPQLVFNKEEGHTLIITTGSKAKYKFAPLVPLNLKKTPKNLLFEYEVTGYVEDGIYKDTIGYDFEYIISQRVNFMLLDQKERVSKYGALYISDQLGGSRVYIVKKKSTHYNDYCSLLGLTDRVLGKFKVITSYSDIISSIVKSKSKPYNLYKPTNEWIENYKKNLKLDSAAYQRKQAKKVFVKHYLWGVADEMYEHELSNRTGITIYGFREDTGKLSQISEILKCKKSLHKGRSKAAIVIQVAKNVEKLFKNNIKAIHCSEFFKTRLFKKIATAHLLYDETEFGYIDKYSPYVKQFKDLEDKVIFVRRYIDDNRYNYCRNVLTIAREHNAFMPEIVKLVEELRVEELPLPLLEQIDYFDNVKEEVVEYLKFKKVRLNNIFYLKPKINEQASNQTNQEETIQESSQEDSEESVIEERDEETSEERLSETEVNLTEDSSIFG